MAQEDAKQYNTTPEATQKEVTRKMKNRTKKAIEKKNEVLEKLSIVYVPVSDLKPNEYNPNRQSAHDFELLCRSMQEDGFTQPIVAQQNNVIVDGEHRWRAAISLGYKEIPVVHVEMTVEQMRISTLRHNRARGSEDVELSAQVLRDLRELGALDWAQDSLMLDDAEMNKLLDDIPAPEALQNEEFSSSWEPTVDATEVMGNEHSVVGMTQTAADQIRIQEQRIKEAKTEEEKKMIKADSKLFRISVIYYGEEADIIKAVMDGKKPAEVILELCQNVVR